MNDNRLVIREKKDFLHLVRKYTDIKELEFDVVRELIDKIVVHDQVPKGEARQIDIYYRFGGLKPFININLEDIMDVQNTV